MTSHNNSLERSELHGLVKKLQKISNNYPQTLNISEAVPNVKYLEIRHCNFTQFTHFTTSHSMTKFMPLIWKGIISYSWLSNF